MNELVQNGIAALKSGDRATARKLLAAAVQQDTQDVSAWLWLAAALDKDEERLTCLQQVLRLDPGNQAAARGLAQILEHRTRPAAETVQKSTPAAPAAAPAPQVRPTPPPPERTPVPSSLETTQPTRPAPAEAPEERAIPTPPRIEPQPVPTPTVPPARAATPTPPPETRPAPETSEMQPPAWEQLLRNEPKLRPEPPSRNEFTADDLRAAFAAAQPEPEAAPEMEEAAGSAEVFPVETEPDETEPDEEAPAGLAEPAQSDDWALLRPSLRGESDAYEPAVIEPEPLPEPTVSDPTGEAAPAAVPAPRRRASTPDVLPTRVIFRTRPSMVPALLCFWLFFFGSVMIGNLLGQIPMMAANITIRKGFTLPINTAFALGMGLLLELVVLYTALRIFTVRYELTNHYLWVYFRGKRAKVPIENIYRAECHQTLIQKIIGTGHLELDLSVRGELAHVRLRDIPDCPKRMDQIMHLVRELD